MKKFFTLIAAVAMAVSANAQKTYSLAGLTSESFIYDSSEWSFVTTTNDQGETLNYFDLTKASTTEYSSLEVKDTPIVFFYKNNKGKTKAFSIFEDQVTTQSKGFRVNVDAEVGDKVVLTVASKGSTAAKFAIYSGATGTIPNFRDFGN